MPERYSNKLLMMKAKTKSKLERQVCSYLEALGLHESQQVWAQACRGSSQKNPVTHPLTSGLGIKGRGQEARGVLGEQQC